MQAANEGIWEGYDGEWRHVSRLLISLADAIRLTVRLAAGAGCALRQRGVDVPGQSNFHLLRVTGPKMPHELERSNANRQSWPSQRYWLTCVDRSMR